jgi:hypothetical protein
VKNIVLQIIIILTFTYEISAAVSVEQFQMLKESTFFAFEELRPNVDTQLEINKEIPGMPDFWWNLEDRHASYGAGGIIDSQTFHNIFIFGGLARMNEMSVDGLALVICHELGHGLGSKPFKQSGSSVEGQADWYASRHCLPVIFDYLPQTDFSPPGEEIEEICLNQSIDFYYCTRSMIALKSSISFYEYLGTSTSFKTPSTHVATSINHDDYFYPSHQCRLDTSMNGIFELKRPRCWYPED